MGAESLRCNYLPQIPKDMQLNELPQKNGFRLRSTLVD